MNLFARLSALIIALIAILSVSLGMQAQQVHHVQGELLVKFYKDVDVRQWVMNHKVVNDREIGMKFNKRVSIPMNIYSVNFDFTKIDENELLRLVRYSDAVELAQFNHFVKLRSTEPNDPEFPNQWQYINTGQSGGTPGADIDADLAWDIATGGLTSQGDTIVVCIIDDGIDNDHPDIEPNLWVNIEEIPNNGIDDDANGFVDDYRGWDTGSGSDAVYDGGGHGTPVAGIVGAKGNDGFGVAGVNWDVKLMIVQGGSGVESEVLEAYSYPLTARMRYNSSDGARGAFVVSTNASWGTDFGQPADAPLWCAFYDTLGVHGIISCGATINGNQNVDVIGDLPTACPSDYLISVTNMNHNDQKVTGAGYGAETIDLGAFGQDTWTVSSGGGFGGFGGTSGATPHVAGAIALLYSGPCPNFVSLAKADPAAAALLAKQYVLEGVDPNASLDGITTTGGRLNIFNSMQMLLDDCGPCPPPASLAAIDLTDTNASLVWVENDSILVSNLQWRAIGATDWNVEMDVEAPFALSGLMACTEYEFAMFANCENEDSDVTTSYDFKTDGCCENPTQFAVSDIDNSEITVEWSNVLAAESYNVQIAELGSGAWIVENVTTTGYTFSELNECTEYEIQIQTVCDGMVEYSESLNAKTIGCGACLDVEYCETPTLDASLEWIENVTINTLNSSSETNDGYGDFTGTDQTTELNAGQTYEVSLSPGFGFQEYAEYFTVWIDLNQDGSFDANELVFDAGSSSTLAVSGEITIPLDAFPGLTRLRVGMGWQDAVAPCSSTPTFGEYEDYCVTIVSEEELPCNIPADLELASVAFYEANVQWGSWIGATTYIVRYKLASESDWTDVETNSDDFDLTDLIDCETYEVQVKSVCNEIESEFSESLLFETDCVPCLSPNNLVATNVGEFTAELEWDTEGEGIEYEVAYRIEGETVWTMTMTDASMLSVEGLEECTNYEAKIKSICDDEQSEYSESISFMTMCVPCMVPENFEIVTVTDYSLEWSWDPDEAGTQYILRFKKTADTEWIQFATFATSAVIDGLEQCVIYETQLKSVCAEDDQSDFSESRMATTDCYNVGLDNLIDGLNSWKVYPNPFASQLVVDLDFSTQQNEVKLELINHLGQSLYSQNYTGLAAGQQQLKIDGSDLSAGVYFVKIASNESEQFRKVIRLNE